jgi:hypothetical protein
MRIFNFQGLGALDKPKKNKYAEIDYTYIYHSFLRLRKVKKINLKSPHTKKNPASCITILKAYNLKILRGQQPLELAAPQRYPHLAGNSEQVKI